MPKAQPPSRPAGASQGRPSDPRPAQGRPSDPGPAQGRPSDPGTAEPGGTPPPSANGAARAKSAGRADTAAESAESDLVRLRREIRTLERGIAAAADRQREAVAEPHDRNRFPPYDLHLVYRPMWSVGSELLATYVCLPASGDSGRLRIGDAVLSDKYTHEQMAVLDRFVLEGVCADLLALGEQSPKPILVVPVHLASLSDPALREEVLEIADVSAEAVRRNLIFEVADIHEAIGQSRALEVVNRLAPMCRGVLGQVPIRDGNFAFWKRLGLLAIGSDLAGNERPDVEVMKELRAFAGLAKHNKMRCYVRGLTSLSRVVLAVGAGFDFVEGSVIGDDADNATLKVCRFDLADIYTQLIRAEG